MACDLKHHARNCVSMLNLKSYVMNTRKILSSTLLVVGVLGFVACDKDELKNLTKEEAQTQISAGEQELINKSNEIMATDGYKIQNYFYNFNSPFLVKSNSVKGVGNYKKQEIMDFANRHLKIRNSEIEFHFEHFINVMYFYNQAKGTHTWTQNGWSYQNSPSDKVVVKFPYPSNSTSNNVTITYYDYTSAVVDGQTIPTGIKVKIEKNGNQVFLLTYLVSFTNLSKYSNTLNVSFGSFSILEEVNIDASPNNKLVVARKFVFRMNSKVFYSENFTASATYLSDRSANLLINGTQVMGPLEFRMKVEGNTVQLFGGQSDPNQFYNLSLYTTRGDKVGEFILVKEVDTWELYFKFNNGEQVKAETLLPNVTEKIYSFMLGSMWSINGAK